jgi:hypothetical protein
MSEIAGIGIRVGDHAHEAFRKLILADGSVESVSVCRYATPPALQARRTLDANEQALVDQALELRKDGTTPFWHAIFAVCLRTGTCTSGLAESALFHAGPGELERVHVSSLRDAELSVHYALDTEQIGLASELVRYDGAISHLTQLDFRCSVSSSNEQLIRVICRSLYEGSFVLMDSGHSYHSFGTTLVTSDGRIRFLGRALQFSPIVDTAYIGHQLQQTFSTLRISRGGSLNRMPVVIAVE